MLGVKQIFPKNCFPFNNWFAAPAGFEEGKMAAVQQKVALHCSVPSHRMWS
jgi:hypothetical protein